MIDNFVKRKRREEEAARKANRKGRKKGGPPERVRDDQLFNMTGGIGVKHGD